MKDLIKRVKYIFNQKIKSPRDTKQRIQKIEVNNGWDTHIVHMLSEKNNENFVFKENNAQ